MDMKEIPSVPQIVIEEALGSYVLSVLKAMPEECKNNLRKVFHDSKSKRFKIGTLCSGSDSVVDALNAPRLSLSL